MPLTIIEANPTFKRVVDKNIPQLKVAEMFARTIQGESVSTGVPSTFLRLKDCTLDCVWCDSASVWKYGNTYSVETILDLLEENKVVEDFKNGHHLILTGGSPLLQQKSLVILINRFKERFGFKPYIEVENECTLEPSLDFIELVDQWNNSPKLANSMMKMKVRYKSDLLVKMSNLPNSWFKFVMNYFTDWDEIEQLFLPYIKREQIVLMPAGSNQEELKTTREMTIDLAIRKNVRFSEREHIVVWDKKTGV